MDNMRKDKSEKDVSVLAEEILKSYADEWADEYAAEAEELLRDDEQYRQAAEKYGSYRCKSLKQRALRCAAVLVCAIFIASIAVPIPQAHAWRVWWLDLVTGQNHQDTDVRADDEYVGEYYVSELPEGFELETERRNKEKNLASYKNSEGESITFLQAHARKSGAHFDNETTKYKEVMIGDFEVLVGRSEGCFVFEMMTDTSFIMISTDASYETGKQFIENLKEI